MFIRDTASATSPEVTPEGFLRLRARIGRAGLHDYRAQELGAPAGFAPDETVRVYRPPEEVFDPASLASFAGKPVTDDHPPAMVDATSWRRYAIGHAGDDVRREGDHVTASLLIADAAAAERARRGAQLSNGYHADFDFVPGVTPEGEPYQAIQRNIRGNHVALVEAGRCGDSCATQDAVPAPALAAAVSDCGCTPAAALPDPASLDALVRERTAVIDTARRLLGPAFEPAGRSTAALRRLVIETRLGAAAVRDRDDATLAAVFDTVAALQPAPDPLARHLAVGLRDAAGRDQALAARDRFLTHAWKGVPYPGDR